MKVIERSCDAFFRNRLAGVMALCGLLLSACGQAETPDQPDVVRPVKLIEIDSASNLHRINFPAVIEAASTADVTFQVGGALDELRVIGGQNVSKGEVLARLNPRDYRNAVQQAQARYDSAEVEYQRAEQLIAVNAVSRSVYDQRKAELDVARASLDSARKSLEDTILRSPFDGVVAQIHADQHQNVAPQQPIVTIQTTGAAEALVHIPSRFVAQSGRITPLETVIVLDAAPGIEMPAELYDVSTQADASTQTFSVRFAFTPPEDLLILPGMAGMLRAQLSVAGADGGYEQITVPLGAVLYEDGQTFVWVIDKDAMTVSKRAIELEESVGENLIVRSGLQVGESIAGAGASYLHEGMKIRPYEG